MTNKPGRRADDAEAVTQKARTAHDYAVEHAEYMAKSAERLIAAIDDMRQAEADALDTSEIVATAEQVIAADEKVYAAHEAVTEGICTLQDRIYQFRKRADRAAAAPQPAEQQPAPDVAGLVEALEQCITSMLDSGYRADAVVIRAARTALATHQKRDTSHDNQ